MLGISPVDIEFFQKVFQLFSGGKEFMTEEELGVVMSSLGEQLTPLELADLVNEVDLNGNGSIDFEEFLLLVFRKLKDPVREELRLCY